MSNPKTVHRVWLGPNLPPPDHDYTDAWKATNPDYELVTWTDDKVAADLDLVQPDAYEQAPTYVHRADLILYEAVHALGGVAVGYDLEPLRSIGPLIDGQGAWCTPDADGFPGQAFFGAPPGHRAIRAVLDRVLPRIEERGGWEAWAPHQDTGPYLWGDVFGRFGEHAAEHDLAVLGDWRLAYPVRYWEKGIFDRPAQLQRRLRDAYVVHRFAHSWANPEDVLVRQEAS